MSALSELPMMAKVKRKPKPKSKPKAIVKKRETPFVQMLMASTSLLAIALAMIQQNPGTSDPPRSDV